MGGGEKKRLETKNLTSVTDGMTDTEGNYDWAPHPSTSKTVLLLEFHVNDATGPTFRYGIIPGDEMDDKKEKLQAVNDSRCPTKKRIFHSMWAPAIFFKLFQSRAMYVASINLRER